MAGLETVYGHYRTKNKKGQVTEGDGWLINNTTTSGHQYVSDENGDSDRGAWFEGEYGSYWSAHIVKPDQDKQDHNALYVVQAFLDRGWSPQAATGMIANMQYESRVDPGAYLEYQKYPWPSAKYAVGLTQWNSYVPMTNWAKDNGDLPIYSIDTQIARIDYERDVNGQYGRANEYPFGPFCEPNFSSYAVSTLDVRDLAKMFYFCYERSGSSEESAAKRAKNAVRLWETVFEFGSVEDSGTGSPGETGGDSGGIIDPNTPGPPYHKIPDFPIWLPYKMKEMNWHGW